MSDFKVSSSRAASRSTTFSNDPFDCLDDFSSTASTPSGLPVRNISNNNLHANIRSVKPLIQPKPTVNIGNANFYSSSSHTNASPANFEDTLSNGKISAKPVVFSMPTIIKPASSSNNNRKPSPVRVPLSVVVQKIKPMTIKTIQPTYQDLESTSDESYEEPPSPPMPSIPAPVLVLDQNHGIVVDDEEQKDSYGIALFDFESDVTEDLNFRVSYY